MMKYIISLLKPSSRSCFKAYCVFIIVHPCPSFTSPIVIFGTISPLMRNDWMNFLCLFVESKVIVGKPCFQVISHSLSYISIHSFYSREHGWQGGWEGACKKCEKCPAGLTRLYFITYLPTDICLFESKPKGSGGYTARAFPGSTILNVWWRPDNLVTLKLPVFTR